MGGLTHPVFQLTTEQGEFFERATWRDFDDDHLIMPFSSFSIVYDAPVRFPRSTVLDNISTSEEERRKAQIIAEFMGVARYDVTETESGLCIEETVRARNDMPSGWSQAATKNRIVYDRGTKKSRWVAYYDPEGMQGISRKLWNATASTDQGWFDVPELPPDQSRGGTSWWPVQGVNSTVDTITQYNVALRYGMLEAAENGDMLAVSDDARTCRSIISFLLALNHRDVRAVYGPSPTRQVRRAAEREGRLPEQPIMVYIPREKVAKTIADVAAGRCVRQRRPHMVRGHLRLLHGGKVAVPVRPHKRGQGEARIPIYDARSVPSYGYEAKV